MIVGKFIGAELENSFFTATYVLTFYYLLFIAESKFKASKYVKSQQA